MMLSTAQAQAIHPQYSCWVEASAGTGKTKVLTDRVMSLLLAGVSVDEILCLTFTKAAGAEMADRIRHNLLAWTSMDDTALKTALASFLAGPPSDVTLKRARSLFFTVLQSTTGIRIQTIHGFCQFLLRAFPLEAGLLPHFRVMDETEQAQLLKKVEETFWQTLPHDFRDDLVRHLSLAQFEQFIPFILGIRHLLQNPDKGTSTLGQYLAIGDTTADIKSFVKDRRSLFQNVSIKDPKTQRDQQFLELITLFRTETRPDHLYSAYKTFFLTATGQPRKTVVSKALYQQNPDLQDIILAEQTALQQMEDECARLSVYKKSLLLMKVGQHFLKLYHQQKHKVGGVDYDDLIHYATQLLQKADIKPWVLEKLDYHFHHILVDEAQDTSETQWALLFQLISEFFIRDNDHHRTLFIVGDPKQSIYSFQGASPKGFQKASQMFQTLDQARAVHLSTSYRSAPEVLNVVNAIFEDNQKMGTNLATHVAHRSQAKGAVLLHPLMTTDEEGHVSPWVPVNHQKTFITARRKVASQIADQIDAWLQSGTMLPSRKRAIEPRDIMILVRRRDAFMQDMVHALKTRGIPVSGVDRVSLGSHIAVKDLLALLDVLLMPEDDLTLATVLRSPFFGISEAALKKMCVDREGTLWASLAHHHQHILHVLEDLQKNLSHTPTLSAFFYDVLMHKQYHRKFIRRMGPGVEDIFTSFLDIVAQFEKDHGPHASLFLTWMRGQDIEVKRAQEGTTLNEVRLMTVHAAKGLQAPIVMLPDTTQVPQNKSAFYAQEGSPFFLWADSDERRAAPAVGSFCARNIRDAEYQRLLYVALTRAEDYLYVYGWETKQQLSEASWYAQIHQAMHKLGTSTDHGMLHGTLPAETIPVVKGNDAPQDKSIPQWMNIPLPEPQVSSVVPSGGSVHEEDDGGSPSSYKPSFAQDKGIRVHHILEHAIRDDLPWAQIQAYIDQLSITEEARADIQKAVKAVWDHPILARKKGRLFKTEVPVKAIEGSQHINGIMDLLILSHAEQALWILDYKTGRFRESYQTNPPAQYQAQMVCYKQLMEKVYPDYTIHTGLIWTDIGWLQPL